MINNTFIFIGALFMVIKGATFATKYAARLAQSYRLSKYTVGFIIVAVISVLPELFVSISSAINGIPEFGLGVLFGANIADLTLVFAAIILLTGRGLKIESKILKNHAVYPFLLLLPLILGSDGYFSRLEGVVLIIIGGVFYYTVLKNGVDNSYAYGSGEGRIKNLVFLILSVVILLIGSHFVVTSALSLAGFLQINPILIGMLIVGLGTTMPEFFFSLKSVKNREDSLAVGDILGTVLANATVVVGILALIQPFAFPQRIIYITGAFMAVASFILFYFMRSGRVISKKEARALLAFWMIFILIEFAVNI